MGITGIKELMEEMAEDFANKDNKEVQEHMLEQSGKSNYIPPRAKEEYAQAFLLEFCRFIGQPYEEESSGEVEIKILGPGCPQCDQLEKTIIELFTELNLPAGLEHLRDMKEIARYRIMSTPALLINGKVVAKGNVPPKDKITTWLMEAKV
ncbi:MAG: thioredoxin family protein [Desulfoferrobacter sp.]